MKILLIKWNGLGHEDIEEAFTGLGHEVTLFPFKSDNLISNPEIEKSIKEAVINSSSQLVFSFNYFPLIGKVCHENGLPYFAWVYDSPAVLLYHFSLVYPTNHVFLFDYEEYAKFKESGINTVYYMPLAANPHRLCKLLSDKSAIASFDKSKMSNEADIAFVGSLYKDNHQFYDRLTSISPKCRGYLEGLMAAQRNVYGYNFIQQLLTDSVMDEMYKDLPMNPNPDGVETRQYLFGEYVINRKITAIERQDFLESIGKAHKVDLYTFDKEVNIDGVINHGPVDYYLDAPFVYNRARINLNISLRSIHSGIPLRCFEIMASGGFLLTNFQSGLADCFTLGEECLAFESREDMLKKIDYYLAHEEERKAIAENGYKRILSDHTYEKRIGEMLSLL